MDARSISAPPDWPLVRVEWIDSAGAGSGWQRVKAAETIRPSRAVSVGFLIHEDDDCLTVAGHVVVMQDTDPDDGGQTDVDGAIVIPKCCVLARSSLTS